MSMSALSLVSTLRSRLPDVDDDTLDFLIEGIQSILGDIGASSNEQEALTELVDVLAPHVEEAGLPDPDDASHQLAVALVANRSGGAGPSDIVVAQSNNSSSLSAPISLADEEDLQEDFKVKERERREATEKAERDAMQKALEDKQRARNAAAEKKAQAAANRAIEIVKSNLAQLNAELAEKNQAAAKWRANNGRLSLGAVVIPSFDLPNPGGGANLLENANATLVPGRRYALVGRNGKGKSTLLRWFAAGRLGGLGTGAAVHLVNQEVSITAEQEDATPGEVVVAADVERSLLLDERTARVAELGGGEDEASVDERVRAIDERLEAIESATAEVRAERLLINLGFSDAMRARRMRQMSGGWRVRTMLACALFAAPDVLLLDEPTNHLSIDAVLWLARELATGSTWKDKIIIIVSHDRHFLDDAATDTLHVSGVARRLSQVRGSYSLWAGRRAEEQKALQRRVDQRQEKINELKAYAGHGFKYGGSSSQINMMTRKAHEAEKLEKEGADEAYELAALMEDAEAPLALQAGGLLDSQAVVQLRQVSFRYNSDESAWLLRNVDLTLTSKSRVVLLGENGVGKTTALKLIQGMLEPSRGEVFVAGGARVATVNQHHADQLDFTMTPLQFMLSKFPGSGSYDHEIELRSHLAQTGVPAELQTTLAAGLSGGQRSRVALAAVSYQRPHILLLDEPTNNLDLESVGALADCVRRFEGGVLIVSHDQYFVENCCAEGEPEIYAVGDGDLSRVESFARYRAKAMKRLEK